MIRLTWQVQRVLEVLLDDPREEWYGLELIQETGILSGSLYPILMRLERFGLLESRWEDIDETVEGRRRRRYYRLTGEGLQWAVRAMASRREQRLRLTPRWEPS